MTDLLALLLILVSVACSTGYSTLIKLSGNRVVLFGAINFFSCLGFLCLMPLVPVLERDVWPILFASVITYNIMLYFISKAYENNDLSGVFPITAAVKFCAVILYAKLIFSESATFYEWVGIIGVAIGIFTQINWRKMLRRDEYMPVFYIVMAGIIGGLQFSLDIYGTRQSTNPFSYIVYAMVLGFPVMLYAVAKYKRKTVELVKNEWRQIIGSALMDNIGYAAILLVMYSLKVLYVVPLSNLSIVAVTCVGLFVLKEPLAQRRIISSFIILVSILLIQFSQISF